MARIARCGAAVRKLWPRLGNVDTSFNNVRQQQMALGWQPEGTVDVCPESAALLITGRMSKSSANPAEICS